MAAQSSLECIGIGRRLFRNAQRTGGRQNNDGTRLRLQICSMFAIAVLQAQYTPAKRERPRTRVSAAAK